MSCIDHFTLLLFTGLAQFLSSLSARVLGARALAQSFVREGWLQLVRSGFLFSFYFFSVYCFLSVLHSVFFVSSGLFFCFFYFLSFFTGFLRFFLSFPLGFFFLSFVSTQLFEISLDVGKTVAVFANSN
jgi:hypothetical protein